MPYSVVIVVLFSDTSSLSDIWFANIFSFSLSHPFTFLSVFFEGQMSIIWPSAICLFSFHVILKKALPNPRPQRFMPIFSSKNFIILAISSLILFEVLHFCIIYKVKVQLHFFCMWLSNCLRTICWKTIFSPQSWHLFRSQFVFTG